jgi:hypothetical protein
MDGMNEPLAVFIRALAETAKLFFLRDLRRRRAAHEAAEIGVARRALRNADLNDLVPRLLLFAHDRMQSHGVAGERTVHEYVVEAVQMALDGRAKPKEEGHLFRTLCLAIEELIVSDATAIAMNTAHRARTPPSVPATLPIDPGPTIEAILLQIAA